MKAKFGRVPLEVSCDQRVSDRAARLYGFLAAFVFHGNACTISLAQMAEAMRCSRSSAKRALDELIECGHVAPGRDNQERQRGFYCLTSEIFAQRQGKEDVVVREASGVPRYVSVDHAAHGIKPRKDRAG